MKKAINGIHAIVDSVEIARAILSGGVRIIQFRNKTATTREFLRIARLLKKLTQDSRAVFIVNDRADIACLVDADGVHLGQDDLPVAEARKIVGKGKIIGVSTHSKEEALKAEEDGADYIGYGPIFATASKEGALPPRGIAALKEIASVVALPVIAIGGIREDNLRMILDAGAQGAALISEFSTARDVIGKTRSLLKQFK